MRFKKGIKIGIIAIFSMSWMMCSSTNPGMTAGGGESTAQGPTDTSKDDDVLQLLGIPSEEETASDLDAVRKEKDDLQKRLDALTSEIKGKDDKISSLQNELKQKNQEMGKLEDLLNELQSGPPAGAYEKGYEAALAEYYAKNYEAAIAAFEQLLQQDSGNELSDNCQYWIGESYYGMGMYQRALLEFEKVSGFVDSNKEDASQLKIALCYERLNQIDNAKDALQRFLVKYPNSEYVETAQQILARL